MSNHRGRRPYPPEFKREAVELYRRSGKSLQVVAGELGEQERDLLKRAAAFFARETEIR